MPCHPDRVRRHYQDTWRRHSDVDAEQLQRRSHTAFVTRCTCVVITGGHRVTRPGCPTHDGGGVTANVIEGDHH